MLQNSEEKNIAHRIVCVHAKSYQAEKQQYFSFATSTENKRVSKDYK